MDEISCSLCGVELNDNDAAYGLTAGTIDESCLVACQGKKISLPEKFHPAPEFLEWHNQNRFLG